MTRFRWGLATDVGRVRSINQDNALAIEGLFAVADGMGGHRGGEVASEVAVRALRERAPLLSSSDLIDAIHLANDAILEQSFVDESLRGMGTTLCVVALIDADGEPRLAVANVGDSRVYLFASGELEQMTDDHSLVAALVREGRITQEEAEEHPQRNILTRALGIDHQVVVDAWEVAPFVGDRWVLCSDGLFNEVSLDQMASVLRRLADPDDAARELVRLANEGGGRDNITVLVVDLVDADGHAVIAPGDGAERATAASSPNGEGSAPELVDVEAGAPTDASDGPAPRRSRFTWRVALFAFALIALLGVVIGAIAVLGSDDTSDAPPPTRVTTSVPAPTTTVRTATTTTTTSTTVPPITTTVPPITTTVPPITTTVPPGAVPTVAPPTAG